MIRRLMDWALGGYDPAWKPTGIRRDQRCYDHAKAVAAQERADEEAAKRRKLADRFAPPKPKRSHKPAEVIAMTRRRSGR